MEFLVNIEVRRPIDDDADFDGLVAAERRRAVELVDAGVLRRIWRVPGRRANWSLWYAADATALHEAIMSLPLAPWLDVVSVLPLASHPSDPGYRLAPMDVG